MPALASLAVLSFLCISAGALREAWRLRRQAGLASRGRLVQRASFGIYVPLMLGLLLAAGLLGPATPPLLLWPIFLATPMFVLAYFAGWLVRLLGRLREGRGHLHPLRTVLAPLAPHFLLACIVVTALASLLVPTLTWAPAATKVLAATATATYILMPGRSSAAQRSRARDPGLP
ncbi:MAG: hypothetical protein AB1941_01390 [Gemmatimonadota bacterium]